jgi:hypothetical protein
LFTATPSIWNAFSGEVVPLIETPNASICAPGATAARFSNDLSAVVWSGTRLVNAVLRLTPVLLDPMSTVGAFATTSTSSSSETASGKSSALARMVVLRRIVTPTRA